MKRLLLFLPIVALFVLGTDATAQEESDDATPGVVAVRYFQCPFHHQSEAVRRLNENFRPIVEEVIDEGGLLDYGIMTHSWGDRWNVVDYFVAEDLPGFHEAFAETFRRVAERFPDEEDPPFGELCPEHKDNIYFTVAPPSDDDGGM